MPYKCLAPAGAVMMVLAGCAAPQLRYEPNPPTVQSPVLPLRITVRPFSDATPEKPMEDKMFIIPALFVNDRFASNLTRSNLPSGKPYMTSAQWSQWFAEDLARSGFFPKVDYAGSAETPVADVIVEGTLRQARWEGKIIMVTIFPVYVTGKQIYTFDLHARRASDGQVLWEGSVTRSIKGMSSAPERTNTVLRAMMFDIEQQLVKGLEARRAEWPAGATPWASVGPER